MSRSIDLTVPQAVPRNEMGWKALGDRLEHRWRDATDRRPLSGTVTLSYIWNDYRSHSIEDEAEIALELAARTDFMRRADTRVIIALARCEKAEENSLRIMVSEL